MKSIKKAILKNLNEKLKNKKNNYKLKWIKNKAKM